MTQNLIYRSGYMQQLKDLKDVHIIKVITGMRRVGKSTLLKMFADDLLNNGVKQEQIIMLNFEDLDVLEIGGYKEVYDYVKKKIIPDAMNYVILDEVQNIELYEKLVDSLFIKNNIDLYITGSNAYLLSGELATLLSGRYIQIEMLPFSFSEYLKFTSNSENLTKDESFRNFLFFGGIPQTSVFEKISTDAVNGFLSGIIDTVIEKDIFLRHEIYNPAEFNQVLDFVMDAVGSEISPKSVSDYMKSNGTKIDDKTISNYLSYLTDAKILHKVQRYDIKGKKLLRTLAKFYLTDTGLRQARLSKSFEDDFGHLLENIVYLELLRRNRSVQIGKTRDSEVDFVVTDNEGYVSYYQVAWSTKNETTLERELASLNSIKDSNSKYLLTTDWDTNPVYNGIRKLNVIDWLLEGNLND
jgi:predicted AAA+ superfamily ATPase